jgi:peptidoglycan/LPS O-acetylase OafA/YrhL
MHVIPQMPSAKDHFHWLDLIRFLAAFMVVATHARGGNWADWGDLDHASRTGAIAVFFFMTRTGAEWVTVFFVLSGFLVGGRLMERVSLGTFKPRDYVIDRATRIWIPLIPALLWSAYVASWVGMPYTWGDVVGNALGLQLSFCPTFIDNTPLWSLSFEMWFYVLAGAFASGLIARTPESRLLAYVALLSSFIIFTLLKPVFLFCWLLGAVAYGFRGMKEVRLFPWLAGGLIVMGYTLSELRSETVSIDTTYLQTYLPRKDVALILLSLGLSLLFPWLVSRRPVSVLARGIEYAGQRLALFSYTLYLTHYPVLALWDKYHAYRYPEINSLSMGCYGAKIASSLLVAFFFYWLFESRTAIVRRWLQGLVSAGR